jgi:hypothetical protein
MLEKKIAQPVRPHLSGEADLGIYNEHFSHETYLNHILPCTLELSIDLCSIAYLSY